MDDPNEDEDLIDPNERRPMRLLDSRIQRDGELSDSDDEAEGVGRRQRVSHRDPDEAEGVTITPRRHGVATGIMAAHTVAGGSGSSGGPSAMVQSRPGAPKTSTTPTKVNGGPAVDAMDVDEPPIPKEPATEPATSIVTLIV